MKINKIKQKIIIPILFTFIGLSAQNNTELWQTSTLGETESKAKVFRNTIPQEFKLFTLNIDELNMLLADAPERFTVESNTIIQFPTKDGIIQNFRVYEASILDPSLQAQHPNIRSYTAQGIDDPSAVARFSYSTTGLNAMISSANYGSIYIDPYTTDLNQYISYSKSTLPADSRSFECLLQTTVEDEIELVPKNADDGLLRTYRLALACTGEYAQYHLNNQGVPSSATDEEKKAAVLAEMNTAMTRVNGIYENEIAVTMVIVANNTEIIFLNASSDPYTNNNGGVMLGQNQSTIDATIGSANYDIGHVFSTGGGGIAGLGVVCSNNNKARGVTGLPSPIGDGFYVDYVCHEMGHQFRANHTQNNNCNRNNGTAMEPGSGSTIMGYAGICSPNVQNSGDAYFHAISVQEIWNFVSNLGGATCPVEIATGNLPPTADAGPDYTIPKSTPFILMGTATDPDSEGGLSHNWEQMNQQIGSMPPSNTSVFGPMFRSDDALPSPNRYMPKLATVLAGQTQSTWEVVPSVSRTMKFRYSVRDNEAGGASSASDDMTVTVNGDSGPFLITSQGESTTWTPQSSETITWEVAGTDSAPVNSPNVDILFSTDGGQNFDVIIAEDIPNNGSAEILAPNLNTTTGRLMIISSNNIFYDINGGIITVEGELNINDSTFENFAVWPNPSNGFINLSLSPSSNENIQVSLYDIKGSRVYTEAFESNGVVFQQSIDFNTLNSGIYFIKVSSNGVHKTTKLIIN
ncbi:MAG: zinc-dependent metalloprotease family protein [Flavobacteriaceae bacterium]|nr:zinc-dependent metalloprotease family protein [Flavobacteriaceae bacterium]